MKDRIKNEIRQKSTYEEENEVLAKEVSWAKLLATIVGICIIISMLYVALKG